MLKRWREKTQHDMINNSHLMPISERTSYARHITRKSFLSRSALMPSEELFFGIRYGKVSVMGKKAAREQEAR